MTAMRTLLASFALLPALAAQGPPAGQPRPAAAGAQDPVGEKPAAGPQGRKMSWTGVLDEKAFAALHELKEGAAPELLGQMIDLAGEKVYLSLPKAGEPPFPAVVVIHEWWGLNDHIKHWTDRLAADGYAALAVDLYGGVVATTRQEAVAAMQSIDEERARKTLRAALDFLAKDERVKASKRGSIGWCFGGGWSLQLAMAAPDLDAAVVYYGRLVTEPEELAKIRARMLAVFGDKDQGIPPDAVNQFEQGMRAARKDIEILRYDANHAFANPSSARYDQKSATAAWTEVRKFLAEVLKGEGGDADQTETAPANAKKDGDGTDGGGERPAKKGGAGKKTGDGEQTGR